MTRGIGELDVLHGALPEWTVMVLALVTQLGDAWFLALLVGALYLLGVPDREEAAVVIAIAIAGYAALTALKVGFALPRPERALAAPEAVPPAFRGLYDATATASGYGFPSGHAFVTTVVYGALATRLPVGTRRVRLLAASTLVGAVSFSRVALGVHYLVDVLAGVAVGLFALVAMGRAVDRTTRRAQTAFALAVGVALVATAVGVLVSRPFDPDLALLLGAALGGFGAWAVVETRGDRDPRGGNVAPGPLGDGRTLAVAALAPLVGALAVVTVRPHLALAGATGLVVAAGIALPHVTDRFEAVGS